MNKNAANIYRFTLPDSIGQGLIGLSPTVTIAKNSATTFSATTNSATEVNSTDAPGLYEIQFTASECNCNLLTIRVTLATGQAPAILDVVEMQGASGATPAEFWGYSGGKFVDNTIPTVNEIWGRQAGDTTSRTITNTIPSASDNASAVWSAQTKEVTIASTQADTFATADALSSVASNVSAVKAKTDNLPESPAAVGAAMTLTETTVLAIRNNLATITATDALAQGLNNLASYGDIHWTTADVSGLSTFDPETDTVTIEATQAETMLTATGFATPQDIPMAKINSIHAGLYNWELQNVEDVESIVAKDANGDTLTESIVTRNTAGEIVQMEEENE